MDRSGMIFLAHPRKGEMEREKEHRSKFAVQLEVLKRFVLDNRSIFEILPSNEPENFAN